MDAERTIQKKISEELKRARHAAEQAAKKHGFSLNELIGHTNAKTSKAKSSKPKAPAKYKNPDDPSQTWTGRGRQPVWFKAALENGKSPDDMQI
jgi:DNA-binding protein H-NS